jgi:flagellar motor switch protein FliN
MNTLVKKNESESASDVEVDVVELDEIQDGKQNGVSIFDGNLDVIRNVKVTLDVFLGSTELDVGELFDLKNQSVVKLDRDVTSPVDIRLDNNVVARGELVVVDDNYGIRITEISSWK